MNISSLTVRHSKYSLKINHLRYLLKPYTLYIVPIYMEQLIYGRNWSPVLKHLHVSQQIDILRDTDELCKLILAFHYSVLAPYVFQFCSYSNIGHILTFKQNDKLLVSCVYKLLARLFRLELQY